MLLNQSDIEEYRPYLNHLDMCDETKDELIHTVFKIMENFVDRAFDDDPVQQALAVQIPKDAKHDRPMIDLKANRLSNTDVTRTFDQMKGQSWPQNKT